MRLWRQNQIINLKYRPKFLSKFDPIRKNRIKEFQEETIEAISEL